jgi:hypothetical protein
LTSPARFRLGLAAVALVAAAVWFLVLGPPPAPGFIRDEASISYNAYTISQNLHDQLGGALPLYLKSFGDYKSPFFVYVLAAVFRVTGPSRHVALDTAAVLVFAAIALIGLLAWRRTRSLFVVCGTVVLGALTPWLYELGGTAYETIIEPLSLVLVLLAVDWAYRSQHRSLARAVPVALALAAVAYSYAAGRLLAPLLAVALLVFVVRDRARWRWVLETWGVFLLTLVPLIAYTFRHPGALSARYESTTFITPGMSPWTIVQDFATHYIRDADLGHWMVSGDPRPYIHVHGAAQLYITTVVIALVGVAVVLRKQRADRFWWFILAALILSPVPAALTADRDYSLRLLPIPVLLIVLGIPALDLLRRSAARDWPPRLLAAALVLVVAAQFWQWRHNYDVNNPGRATLFEAGVAPLLERAFAGGQTVSIDHDDAYAQAQALWYAVTHHLVADRVNILPDGGAPPNGSMVFGRLQACDYTCIRLAQADTYWIARAHTG